MALYQTTTTSKIKIYKNPEPKDQIGTYKKGDTVSIEQEKSDTNKNNWGKTDKGWIKLYDNKKKKSFIDENNKKQDTSSGGGKDSWIPQTGSWETTSKKIDKMKAMMKLPISDKLRTTMQLFGIPYQFTNSVDCRIESVSPHYGRKFATNFILSSPVVTILPGKPKYLPAERDKQSTTEAFLDAAAGNLGALKSLTGGDEADIRLYDFETAYIEYMTYVNILCRTCASFLELDRNAEDKEYEINGEYPDFLKYDWKNYRWNGENYSSTAGAAAGAAVDKIKEGGETVFSTLADKGSSIIDYISGTFNVAERIEAAEKAVSEAAEANGNQLLIIMTRSMKAVSDRIKKNGGKTDAEVKAEQSETANEPKVAGETTGWANNELDLDDPSVFLADEEKSLIEHLGRKVHYVQFYCDPTATGPSESFSNSTQSSTLKGILDQGSGMTKEIAFLANSGGADTSGLEKLGQGLIDGLGSALGTAAGVGDGGAGKAIKRLFSMGSNIASGDGIIMPDFYAGSSRSSSFSLSIPLKPVYGNKYSLYMDFLVPYMHLLPLAFPRATSGNSYSSPFLLKIYMRGRYSCSLGLCTGISVEYEDTFNIDGLPMGGTVRLEIQDLYPDITLTPSNAPFMFTNNSSLIEYLATSCGLNLLESKFTTKINMMINNLETGVEDVKDNVLGRIGEKIDDVIYSFTGL